MRLERLWSDFTLLTRPKAVRLESRTGRINDGKVFVVQIQEAIRIRTGERGEEAV